MKVSLIRKSILIAIILIGSNSLGACAPKTDNKKQTIRVATNNINFSRSATENCKWNDRKNRVLNHLKELDADILTLQEVVKSYSEDPSCTEVSYEDVSAFLISHDYEAIPGKYTTSRKGVDQYNITAYRSKLLKLSFAKNYLFENFYAETHDNSLEKFPEILVAGFEVAGTSLVTMNFHMPTSKKARLDMSRSISILKRMIDREFPSHLARTFILLGDFNSFPEVERGSKEQVPSIVASGFIDLGKDAVWSHPNNPVNGQIHESACFTFQGFPYDVDRMFPKVGDITKNKCHLDHIFISNDSDLKVNPGSITIWNSDLYTYSYIFANWRNGGKKEYSIYPSDHLAMSVELEL